MAWFSWSSLLASHAPISFKRSRGTVSMLSTAKNHFGWELTDRPGNEHDCDRANVFEKLHRRVRITTGRLPTG
jgi:hypothetical protein